MNFCSPFQVAQVAHVRFLPAVECSLSVKRVIVDDHFSVESNYVFAACDDERVDFSQVEIAIFEKLVETIGDVSNSIQNSAFQSEHLCQFAPLIRVVWELDRHRDDVF